MPLSATAMEAGSANVSNTQRRHPTPSDQL